MRMSIGLKLYIFIHKIIMFPWPPSSGFQIYFWTISNYTLARPRRPCKDYAVEQGTLGTLGTTGLEKNMHLIFLSFRKINNSEKFSISLMSSW